MEKGGERDQIVEEANNFEVSFFALRKDVVDVLDFMERLKNEEDQIAVDVAYQIEELKVMLALICTYVQLSYSDLEEFEDRMRLLRQKVENLLQTILNYVDKSCRCKYDMHRFLPSLMDNIDDCINSCHRSKSSAIMTNEQLNFLLLNLHHLSKCCAQQPSPSVIQYEILRKVCGTVRDFHGLIVNGCIKHEIAEDVLPQFQLMAERVGLFLWNAHIFELVPLLLKIVPIQLEVMHVCVTNLKASTSAEVGRFIKQLVETSPYILREYLIHLQQHMVAVLTPSTSGAQNIHVMMMFLLIILTDVPKGLIHHDKVFDLLARVGALIREVSTLVHELEEKSRNKESSDETNRATLDLLENVELLKEDLKHVYLKSPETPDGLLFMHLQKVCENIRNFHGLIVNGCIKHEIAENVLPQLQLMAESIGLFLWDELYSEDSQVINLARLFLKIIPIQLEVMNICSTNLQASTSGEVGHFIQHLETSPDILRGYLIHLQQHMVTVLTPGTSGARNIHVMIEFLLIILSDMPTDFIHHDKLFDLLERVGVLIREVSTLVHGLEEKSRNKESSDETNRATLYLLENIELLKEDLKHVYLKSPETSEWCFPMIDGLLFMHLFLIHLNDLLDSNVYSISLMKEEIELVKEDLEFIRLFFVNVGQGLYKDLWERVLDLAYEAKDVIDSIIDRQNGLLHLIFSLPLTIKKINLIKEEVSDLHEKIPKNRGLIVVNSPNKLVESKSFKAGKIIVGFKEETNLIIKKLTSGPKELDVIPITGMAGLGKTTLAYKVYNDESVSKCFDIRAWCTVGQDYNKKKLWVKAYNQVTGSDLEFSEDIDVADMLRKQLLKKRYLIVLDDVWNTTSWDELTSPFPLVEERSRIILTTREMEVALHGMRSTDPLKLRFLTLEESWELLEKRAFGNESCPDELLDIGKKIAENCEGLPLVADLIAGVIVGLEKKKTVWLEIQNDLSSFISNSEVDQVMKVIELSYDHLPVQVKPCFLYLACYGKHAEVRVEVLKNDWHVEGLMERTEMKSVEEVMKVYMDNLISSSLVIPFNELGDDPTCQLHDLVHDFCLKKAREEKFFDWISSSASYSSSDLMPRKVNIIYDRGHFGLNIFYDREHSGRHLYSLSIFGGELDDNLELDDYLELDDNLSYICHLRHFRLLRVLHLDYYFIKVNDSLLNEICVLNHLRYLCIGTKVKSVPSSFSNLWNLETLVVKDVGSILVLLPRIWDLVKLRVLSVSACSFFDMDTDEPILIAEDSKLEKLRVLEKLMLSYSKDTEDIFKRFPDLQVLSLDIKESWDYSTERYWFPKLDILTELELLNVGFKSSNTNDNGPSVEINWLWDFHFPSNLKILRLNDFPLTTDSLSTIGRLPNLEELYLLGTIMQGEEWNIGEEDTFEKLKCLTLYEVNLAKWEVREEFFPVLEKLVLWRCHKLEEIPLGFGDICSLKIIKLIESPQLEDSAKTIKEYVDDMGGELQILGSNDIPLFKS